MFLRLFRSDFSYQLILLLILGLVLWIPAFLSPPPLPADLSPLKWFSFISSLFGGHLLLAAITGFILTLGIAMMLSLILSANDLAPRSTALPSLVFILLASWSAESLTLNPVIFSIGFLLIFLYYFLKIYELGDALKEVFSAAFSLSLAVMFCFAAWPLFIVLWFGFFVYRVFSWREWIASVIGFTLPMIYAAAWLFWTGNLQKIVSSVTSFFIRPELPRIHNLLDAVIWGLIILLAFLSMLRVGAIASEKIISIRKNFMFINWFFMLSLSIIFIPGGPLELRVLIPLLPASIIIAYNIATLKRLFFYEILFTSLVILIFLSRFL